MNKLPFAAVGTSIATRKNMPKIEIDKKRDRGAAEFLCNQYDTCSASWKDTKDVNVLSNCHTNEMTVTNRKTKDGIQTEIPCPKMIEFYNKYTGESISQISLLDSMTWIGKVANETKVHEKRYNTKCLPNINYSKCSNNFAKRLWQFLDPNKISLSDLHRCRNLS
ncbi:hypothetical protein HHI36_010046 [Cryptolaemus montrouzieri]|uniref:PiggyBac transposable element-derived protein domain-containing protein n=1 Tax=Cryptolaemus montrouzieri TaxID=559131 RepID=A0ABD2MHK6_9CUCU